jgi:serine/threonine protein kinase
MAEERPAARSHASGTRIGGKYDLVKRLATGGMGEVWLAQNKTTHASVALKLLRPHRVGTEAEDRFRREARLSGILAHRSIVRIFDFLEERDGTLVLVMELLQGETLEQVIARRTTLSEREALAVMAAVLSALQHGHEQGIVHRDVKPANIFLSVESDGKVIPKLLDYGIAKMPKNDAKTMDGVVLGTPSYMSPEQIRAEDDLDARSDLFSCGVVFYECLTGTCPFDAPSPAAAIASVLTSSVDPDPRISPRLWLELQRALAKRPTQRHASAAEMRSAMLDVLGETEDSLAPALIGINPRDYGAERSGQIAAMSSPRAAETQSMEGHSVATTSAAQSRKMSSWWPWAAVGALVGSAVMVTAVLRSGNAGAEVTTPSKTPVTTPAPSLPNDLPPPETPLASASVLASIPSAPSTGTANPPQPTAAMTNDLAHTVPSASRPTHHATTKQHTPRPVATSPGF